MKYDMQDPSANNHREHILFVTGRLAQDAVREIVAHTSSASGFEYTIRVLPITVAALMTGKWLLRHLEIDSQVTRVVLPGYLADDLPWIREQIAIPVECGPRDIRELPSFFGKKLDIQQDYGQHRIEILAEINHAPRLTLHELLVRAKQLRDDGADVIDLGCEPGRTWSEVGDAVRSLRDAGVRVSIDSFDPREVELACRAGAELVLSVNSSNRHHALDWGVEVVVIGDHPDDEKNFSETIEFLRDHNVSMRIDPILEPIGCGFAASLQRYLAYRSRWPELPMMMGIGNITELTDADSAAINVLLMGICEELNISSVLTTEVINWSRTSVRECDLARRLVYYACKRKLPPKHVEDRLVLLRDLKLLRYPESMFASLAESIRDHNIRLFIQDEEIHAVSAGVHLRSDNPFELIESLLDTSPGRRIDPRHAFYLGFEMAKALTAITLGKNYEQDEPLRWGFLTRHEKYHRTDS